MVDQVEACVAAGGTLETVNGFPECNWGSSFPANSVTTHTIKWFALNT